MTTLLTAPSESQTLADLVQRLGDVPLNRIRIPPAPGLATEEHLLEIHRREKRLCELVEGVLVEKAMGYSESILAVALAGWLRAFVIPRRLGLVSGESGMMRLFPGLVRIPDVAFASWERFPDRRVPAVPIPSLAPDLVVEVLSVSNTEAEMDRKRGEYFSAGVRLVWLVDPRQRMVAVFTSREQSQVLGETETLNGDPVLSGFTLPLRQLFAELDEQGPP